MNIGRPFLFKCSAAIYLTLLLFVVPSLSVPPHDLAIFMGMAAASISAILTSERETRFWKMLAVLGLIFALVGGILEAFAGMLLSR